MATEDLISISWQLPRGHEGRVVARTLDHVGSVREQRFAVVPGKGLVAVPDEVARIVEDDGREYGVWTRD